MNSQKQNNNGAKLTIFRPPTYIYKLSKTQSKNSQKLGYQIYYNKQYSLRKYNQTINLASQSQLMLYEWRKQSVSPILKVLYVELTKKSTSASNLQPNLVDVSVYTQHVEKLLADMINLTLNEAIYVLNDCMLAYKELFQKLSAVSINKFHIGLNAEGKIKVWINQNSSCNCIQDKASQPQSINNQSLFVQTSIVSKIIHMISLLSNSNCKFFFFGLQKELAIKRFLFNNCLQYIHNFVSNTNNFQVPNNLFYMLPKKTPSYLDRSSVKLTNFNKLNNVEKQRKLSENSSFLNMINFKRFESVVRMNSKQQNERPRLTMNDINEKKFIQKRYSENISKDLISTLPVSEKRATNHFTQNPRKECRISLHIIAEKSKRNSIRNNDLALTAKSNVSTNRQRPSLCVVPSFIEKSLKKDMSIQRQQRSSNGSQMNTQKSHCLQRNKQKDYNSLINSKVSSKACGRFYQLKTRDGMNKRQRSSINMRYRVQNQFNKTSQCQLFSNVRGRSVSANFQFGSCQLPYHMLDLTQHKSQQGWNAQKKASQKRRSNQETKNGTDKVLTNSITNDTTKNGSFVAKTTCDSITLDNEKNVSRSRMNFSSMSMQNRIRSKNFDSDLTNSQKKDVKRSLVAFKHGFQQILEKPSCKQIQQENQSKSYNGSSLKNTQNISQLIHKNPMKNEETASNNFSFGNSSNLLRHRANLNDSVEQNWAAIKQKNDELLNKNQWKKTINNLGQLQQLTLNQSFVGVCDQIIQRDLYPDVKLQKLQRLGRDMCFSIVNKSDDNGFLVSSSGRNL